MTRLSTAELHVLEADLRTRAGELAAMTRANVTPPNYFHATRDATAAALLADEFAAPSEQARELQAIGRALQRIAQGNYGRCRRCGAAIPHSRLLALPSANFCLACQVESERHHSLGGNLH